MQNSRKTISSRAVIQMLIFIVVVPFLPLLISGHWNWWEAWAYALTCILGFAISRALAVRRHPDILAERAQSMQHKDAIAWDKVLAPLVGLGGGLIPLVAGLDGRFGWSPAFSLPVKLLALVVILTSYALGAYALIANRFFSGTVRIQFERGHQVVSTGPYRWVRHPGYVGALLTFLATPVFLDALWAFLPSVLLSVALIIRTGLEDRTLQEQLAGYRDYARRVRYRLLPGVW